MIAYASVVSMAYFTVMFSDIYKKQGLRFDSKEFMLPGPVTGALKCFTVLKKNVSVVL